MTEYMEDCYKNGYLGAMYSIHKQGIPIISPIDQKKVTKAMFTDSKISKKLYTKLGEDVEVLKKRIANNLSRGIATASDYKVIARNIAADSNVGFNRAMRIARTEGHRVQVEAASDAQYAAKEAGADIVKQWNAALDGRTRESHARVDGEIRELDEKFSNGLKYPGDSAGGAAEVVNCRCALLQRAKWALDEDELQTLQDRAAFFGLDKTDDFEEFCQKYKVASNSLKKFDITEGGKYKVLPFDNTADYSSYISPEYNAQRMTHADNSVLFAYDGGYIQNADGYKDINGYMRGLKDSLDNPKCQKTMDVLIRRTSNPALKKDYVGYRKVNPSYLQDVLGLNTSGKLKSVGMPWECFKDKQSAQELSDAINGIVGTAKARVTDKAVTSVSLCESLNFFKHRPVKFEIQMPTGTKGLITRNYAESEFIAKPNSTIEILGSSVYDESGKPCIKIFARMIQD